MSFCWHLNALHYGNFVCFSCGKDLLHTFYIKYISLRAGLNFDKTCSWLLLSFNQTHWNCKVHLQRLDTSAWGPLVHEWVTMAVSGKQNQHFPSHSQCQWTFLCHWQGLSLLHPLWWAQAPLNGQNIEQNWKFYEENRAINGALALLKAEHKKKKAGCETSFAVVIGYVMPWTAPYLLTQLYKLF